MMMTIVWCIIGLYAAAAVGAIIIALVELICCDVDRSKAKLPTLSNHNESRPISFRDGLSAAIACDECGTEMVYSDDKRLRAAPPQRRVRCPNCDFKGTKVIT